MTTTHAVRPPQYQVLYVEDHPTNAALMEALFQRRPHLELHVAGDGAQATVMAAALQPSLLLLDQQLPDCLGSELLPWLRVRFGWRDVPAIAVTAEADFDIEGTGFAELWRKPMDLHAVLRRLDHWLPATPLPTLHDVLPEEALRRRAAELAAAP